MPGKTFSSIKVIFLTFCSILNRDNLFQRSESQSAWVRDGHGKLSSLVTQIWLLLFARLCENLANLTGEH